MKSKYIIDLTSLDENLNIVKGEIYMFEFKGRIASGISARAALLNIKKIVTKLRKAILIDRNNRPKIKRNISPEAIERAKEKRRQTMMRKKNNRS